MLYSFRNGKLIEDFWPISIIENKSNTSAAWLHCIYKNKITLNRIRLSIFNRCRKKYFVRGYLGGKVRPILYFLVMRIESCLFSKIVLTYNSRFYPWNCSSQHVTYNGLKTNCKNAFFQNKIKLKFLTNGEPEHFLYSFIDSFRPKI